MSNVTPGDDAKAQPATSVNRVKSNPKVIVTRSTLTLDGNTELQPATGAAKDAGSKSPVKSPTSNTNIADQQLHVSAAKSAASTAKVAGPQLQETAVKSTTSSLKDAGTKQQVTAPGQPAASAGHVSPAASTESGLRQRTGKVEDVKIDRARVSNQGNFHTLCVVEFAVGTPAATMEWLLGKIQAPRSQGGGELSAELVEEPEKVQIIFFSSLSVRGVSGLNADSQFLSFSSLVSLVLRFCLPTSPPTRYVKCLISFTIPLPILQKSIFTHSLNCRLCPPHTFLPFTFI